MYFILLILGLILIVYFLKFAKYYPLHEELKHRSNFFGVTFSTEFSHELGLDWKNVYLAMLDDLQVKEVRIPVYWDEVEKKEGLYDFSKYDYLIKEGEKRNVKFIIVLGRRVPRWPECHTPVWLDNRSKIDVEKKTLKMIETTIKRYQSYKSIEYWQVENEPFLGTFGVCPPLDKKFLQQEFNLVRSLDKRQIIITGSGEMSDWKQEAKIGDIFGSTLYRVVYNSWFGYFHYPWPPLYYRLKAKLAGLSQNRLFVLELQTEPWVPQGNMKDLSVKQINKSMSISQFKANLQYAIDLNFKRTYLWGVEWWYWQKKYGNPEYWQIARNLFK